MSRRKRYTALAVLATAAVAGGILAGASAGPSEPPVLKNVATANTRSDGYAPASKLSVELRQVAVAQGSTKLEGGAANTVSYYGYDNDTLERRRPAADGADAERRRHRGAQDGAGQEHLPRLQARPHRAPTPATTTARTSSSRATRPAGRATSRGSTSTPTPTTG